MSTLLILESIVSFRRTATIDIFNEIFGQSGDGLWTRFGEYDSDVIRFYDSLGFENRREFANYIS